MNVTIPIEISGDIWYNEQEVWQKKFIDLQEKILHNKNRFTKYVKEQQTIVNNGILT